MIRIAILLCDKPVESIETLYGNYYQMINTLLSNSCALYNHLYKTNIEMEYFMFDATNNQLPSIEDSFDVYILTGSKYSAYDKEDWILNLSKFIQYLFKTTSPNKIIGFCFGHQLISHALGGKVIENPKGWEIGCCPVVVHNDDVWLDVAHTDKSSNVTIKDGILNIYQMHKDHVETMPNDKDLGLDFKCLGSNDRSHVQIMYSKKSLSFQGHPEYNYGIVNQMVDIRKQKGLYSNELLNVYNQNKYVQPNKNWLGLQIIHFIIS